jgi:hypothetical protein
MAKLSRHVIIGGSPPRNRYVSDRHVDGDHTGQQAIEKPLAGVEYLWNLDLCAGQTTPALVANEVCVACREAQALPPGMTPRDKRHPAGMRRRPRCIDRQLRH